MAITIGSTISNSGNKTNTTGFSLVHSTNADTKILVAIVTGYDSSASDSVVTSLSYLSSDNFAANQIYYRSGSAFIAIMYLVNPPSMYLTAVILAMAGTCTDLQMTLINLVSTTAVSIKYQTYAQGDNTGTSHSLSINPAKTGSIAIGAIVDIQSAVTNLSVGTGTEIAGSEADMGSQVVGCAYAFESGGTATIAWTKSASATSSALIAEFFEELPPTVALNSPSNAATDQSLTPALLFTGTDANSDTIEYNIEIDTVNSFDSIPNVIANENYTEHTILGSNSGNPRHQSFQCNKIGKLLSASFLLSNNGSGITGTLSCDLYSFWGTFGSTLETNTLLAQATTINASTLTTTPTWTTFNFPESQQYQMALTYYIILIYLSGSTTTNYAMMADDTNKTHNGSAAYRVGGIWYQVSSYDNTFRITLESTPKISALSSASAGFTAGHPFASGSQITYTVQSADTLAENTTHYWRVRAIDPTGSNTWGAWSSIYSFVTLTAGSVLKTVNALAKASIKTINGLAIAGVKKINNLG